MATVAVTRKTSIVDQLEQLHERIARRAYELSMGRDGWGDALGDWLSAEQELVWKPPIELHEENGKFTVVAALPGLDPKDITVDITPQEVVVRAATEQNEMFCSLSFPKSVETKKARAEYQNGMLNITVPIAVAPARRVDVKVKAA